MIEAKLIAFLAALDAAIPPPENCRHGLTLNNGRLALNVRTPHYWQTFYLDTGDLDAPAASIAHVVAECARAEAGFQATEASFAGCPAGQ